MFTSLYYVVPNSACIKIRADDTSVVVGKAQKCLFFLRRLRRTNLPQKLLVNFYRFTSESILTNYMTAWYSSCTKVAERALQWVVKTAQVIVGTELPSLEHLQKTRCVRRAKNIIKDITQPGHNLFKLPPSGRRFRSILICPNRIKNSFSQLP